MEGAMSSEQPTATDREHGSQPLADLLEQWGLTRADLVEVSPEQLSFKQAEKATSGRQLTLKMRQKLARTFNFAVWGRLTDEERESFEEYFPKHLFSYNKGYDSAAAPLNDPYDLAERKVRRDFLLELGLIE